MIWRLNRLIRVLGLVLLSVCSAHVFSQETEFDLRLDRAYELRYQYPDSASAILEDLLKEALEKGNVEQIILARNNLAMSQKEMGRLGDAIKLVFDNLALIDSTNVKDPQNTYLVAGHVSGASGRMDDARAYYDRALEKFLELDDEEGVAYTYSGMGILEYDNGNFQNALKYYLLSELHWTKSDDPLYADLLNNIGAVYIEFGKFEAALSYYRRSYEIYDDLNWRADVAMLQYNLGELYMTMEDFDSSVYYYESSLQTAQEIRSAVDEYWAYMGLYELNKVIGNSSKALEYFEMYIHLRDSISESQNYDDAMAYKAQYENSLKDQKILEQEVRLENERFRSEKNEQERKRKQIENLFLWISIGLVAAIGLVIFLMYSRIKRVNQELRLQKERVELKNRLIDQSLYEKEILLKEIHHRVKNNLQIISSLLNLQSHRIEDEKAIETLNVSRDRIQAIALVHQKLYQSKDLSKVDFKAYLNDLLDQQKSAYSSLSSKLMIESNCIDLRLSLDVAVPLGIILSELVTNAFKHGLSQISQPKLCIDLYEKSDTFFLQIKDNGPGLPEGFSYENSESLGMEIIQALVSQIEAELTHSNDQGAVFLIKFSDQL